jgi:N-carbamoylputrescine amidase
VGVEGDQTFYGASFISNQRGEKIKELGRSEEAIIVADLDLQEATKNRASFGFFRDRRPEFYSSITEK